MNMSVINKFNVNPATSQIVFMPKGASLLSVGNQQEQVKIWAEVDPAATEVGRKILVRMTGEKLPAEMLEQMKFIGTVQLQSGIVLHIFDCGEYERTL